VTKITEQIWIGNSTDARNPPAEINAILNCAFDLANYRQWDSHHLAQCGLVDGPGNPLSAYYSAVLQLDNLVKCGKRVLVHCHEGKDRSVTVVICYLNARDAKGWDYWRNMIRSLRSEVTDDRPRMHHKDAFDRMDWELLKRAMA
jgi:protein-tyrosine phosphatase